MVRFLFNFILYNIKQMSINDFSSLLVKSEDFLKNFAYKFTKDNESARDLVQETLYKALANREKYNADTNVKAWVYTIMRNIFINEYRRKLRQHTIFDHSPDDFLLNNAVVSQKSAALVNVDLKDIRSAIYKLPSLFRQPFELYLEGYKYVEIAQALHEPLGTIKSRIHFARKLLKEQLTRF